MSFRQPLEYIVGEQLGIITNFLNWIFFLFLQMKGIKFLTKHTSSLVETSLNSLLILWAAIFAIVFTRIRSCKPNSKVTVLKTPDWRARRETSELTYKNFLVKWLYLLAKNHREARNKVDRHVCRRYGKSDIFIGRRFVWSLVSHIGSHV